MDPKKRKYSKISMDQKSQALKRLDRGESVSAIAAGLGIQKSTVCGWKANRNKIEKWCEETKNRGLKTRSRMRAAMDVELDEAVFAWFTQLRKHGTSVTGPIIQSKAVSFNQQMRGDNNFVASTGWLKHWRKRYGIRQLPVCGEKLSTDASAVETLTEDILKIKEDERLTGDQTFNCDETSLNHEMLFSEVLAASVSTMDPTNKYPKISMDRKSQTMKKLDGGESVSVIPAEQLTRNQMIDCDETGLNHKILSSKTFAASALTVDPKRKKETRSKISMDQKSQALKRLDRGESVSIIAADLGIRKSTVCGWKANRKKIEKWCEETKNRGLKARSRMRAAMNVKLDEAVFAWYTLVRKQGTPVTGPIIQSKAVGLNQLMGGDNNFVASTGWLKHWKQRYGIRLSSVCGENLSANAPAVKPFTEELLEIIEDEQLTRDQIFNCGQTGLDYLTLPSKTFTKTNERVAPGFKDNKELVTVLACSNASGTLKLPLMVIGERAKPMALNDLNTDQIPVFYRHEKSAWLNSTLLKEWFDMEFIPRVISFIKDRGLPLKALLIIDSALSHSRGEDLKQGDIKTIFLPPNVTSLIQPMKTLKRRYRYRLISSILQAQEGGGNMVQHLKTVTMRNAIFWLANSWKEVATSAMRKPWHKIWPEEECHENSLERNLTEHEEPSDAQFLHALSEIEFCRNVDEKNLRHWIDKDDEDAEIPSDQEIISLVMTDEQGKEENGNPFDTGVITPAEARDGIIRAIRFFDKFSYIPQENLMVLHWFRDAAASMAIEQTGEYQ